MLLIGQVSIIQSHRHNSDNYALGNDCSIRILCTCTCITIQQAFSKSQKTFKLKERVMLIYAWITDTIFDEQKVPSCGTYAFVQRSYQLYYY